MTAATDLTAQIAEAQRTLAEAMKECPQSPAFWVPGPMGHRTRCRGDCKGTGHVPRFPEFRQECEHEGGTWDVECTRCNGLGWQVSSTADISAALAGLNASDARDVLHGLKDMMSPKGADASPTEPTILAKGLELVIEVAELTSPGQGE